MDSLLQPFILIDEEEAVVFVAGQLGFLTQLIICALKFSHSFRVRLDQVHKKPRHRVYIYGFEIRSALKPTVS